MTTPVYAVTGASGRLGRLPVEQLTACGVPPSDIVALVRTPGTRRPRRRGRGDCLYCQSRARRW